ncbi:MAG TPA: hypothetical protein V6D07_18700 [Trichocoleus sp.]
MLTVTKVILGETGEIIPLPMLNFEDIKTPLYIFPMEMYFGLRVVEGEVVVTQDLQSCKVLAWRFVEGESDQWHDFTKEENPFSNPLMNFQIDFPLDENEEESISWFPYPADGEPGQVQKYVYSPESYGNYKEVGESVRMSFQDFVDKYGPKPENNDN